MIDLCLKNMKGLCYLTDNTGRIVEANEKFTDFFEVKSSWLKGKFLKDLHMPDGDMLDAKNLHYIKSKTRYEQVLEIFKINNSHKNILVNSHKRLLADGDSYILGLLNQSFPVDENEHYNPNHIYRIGNAQLGLKLRENINSIYGFIKQLSYHNKYFTQESALFGLETIIEKMIMTMDGIILDNDKYNNVTKCDTEIFKYNALYLKHEASTDICSTIIESTKIHFTHVSLDIFLADEYLANQVKDSYFDIIIADTLSMNIISKYKHICNFLNINYQTTMIIELIDVNVIPIFKSHFHYLDISYMLNIDEKLFPLWRAYIKDKIKENIKISNTFIILSIEDDVDSQESLKQLLESANSIIQVKTASSGSEALRLAMGTAFDLIIIDINLKDMSGFDVAKQIRAIQQHSGFATCPMYANTGYDYSDKMNYELYGIDYLYIKPYLIYDLEKIIKDFIDIST